MSSGPLLTIAIPTFERDQSLKKCLDFLLPTLISAGKKVELLLLDNASSDNTPSVIASFLGQIPKGLSATSFRHERNVGMSENILACVERSSGLYFMFIGDDDTVNAEGITQVLELLESGASPSAILQGSWPTYGVNHQQTNSVEPKKALDYFFFAGNASAAISRTSFMKEAIIDFRKDRRLRNNIWPQTFLIFHSIFSHPDSAPLITSFPHGAMINEQWIVRPDKTYTIRIVEDLVDVALGISRSLRTVPPPREFLTGQTKKFIELELQLVVSRSLRDMDRAGVISLVSKLGRSGIRVPFALQIRVLFTRIPEFLLALTVVHLFATGGVRSVRRFIEELDVKRSLYRAEVLSAPQTGLRVRDFHSAKPPS